MNLAVNGIMFNDEHYTVKLWRIEIPSIHINTCIANNIKPIVTVLKIDDQMIA